MIDIAHLSYVYPGSRKAPRRVALDDLSLSIGEGEFAILSGPNGSGKSTLFRILSGFAVPSAGQVRIGGFDLVAEPAKVRTLLGVVFQSPAVDKHLMVHENLKIHADLYGVGATDWGDALDWTDLGGRMNDRVDTLSGGLARQVELAKVMLTRPRVLLLDEPTTGLDPSARRNFLGAVHRLHRERGLTVLMTSHVFAEAEDADRVAVMREGKLLAWGSPASLKAMIGTEMVVVRSRDADGLAARMRADLGLAVRCIGEECRLEETENGTGLPLLERILERYRADIISIAIKQPELEDVFVHVTGTKGDAP